MFSIKKTFYGDETRWFVGTLINTTPPAGFEGRVKVRINGIHNLYTGEVPEKDLPWAQVLMPNTEGGISGIGRIPQLLPGSMVFGIFIDGRSSQIPLIIGSTPRVELPTSTQTKTQNTLENYKHNQEKIINMVLPDIDDDTTQEAAVNKRRSQAVKFFIENGYTVIQAASIAAGLQLVSRFILHSDDSTLQGIGAWSKDGSGKRFLDLLDFASMYNIKDDWKKFSVQLQFVLHELRNKKRKANYKLTSAETIEEASEAFAKYYLNASNYKDANDIAEIAYEETLAN